MTILEMDCSLKKIAAYVFMFSLVSRKNCKKLTIVCSSFENIIPFLSVDVLGAFRVREKLLNLNFSTFLTKPLKILVTEPLKQILVAHSGVQTNIGSVAPTRNLSEASSMKKQVILLLEANSFRKIEHRCTSS